MLILLLVIIIITLLFIKNNNKNKSIKYPDGPINLPIIGGLYKIKPNQQHLSLDKLYRQYGPVFSLRLGSIDTVFLNDPEVITEAFHINSTSFWERLKIPSFIIVGRGRNIGFSEINFWKKIRGILNAALTKSKTRLLENLFNDQYFRFDEHLKNIIAQNDTVNMRPVLKKLTFNIIFKYLFGETVPYEDDKIPKEITDFIQCSDELLKYLSSQPSDFIKCLRPFTSHKKLHQLVNQMTSFIQPRVEKLINNLDEENPKCFIEYLIIQVKYDHLQLVKLEDLQYILIELLVGGIDTTSTTLEWMILFLSNNENIQEKLYQDINVDQYPLLTERGNFPFFNATLRETLRRSPAVPLGLPHMCSETTEIGGVVIPKGVLIISNLYSANNNEKFYSDPFTFNPLRFIDTPQNGVHNISFSIGPRVCPGKNFAEDSLFSIGTKLFKNYKFSRTTEKEYSEHAHIGVTLEPIPFLSKITLRN